MIEVFKTNVRHQDQATMLKDSIREVFADYEINFDLQDCDRILRVKCARTSIDVKRLINLLAQHGFYAEVLEDADSSS